MEKCAVAHSHLWEASLADFRMSLGRRVRIKTDEEVELIRLSSLLGALGLVISFMGFLAGTNFALEVPRFLTEHALVSFDNDHSHLAHQLLDAR